ncbi:MAG: hypothetical protein FWE76_05400 [Symbiobacteriaceae bacterium]|nr:hypothetical protein [Symbiobacteriaceae bacterium]
MVIYKYELEMIGYQEITAFEGRSPVQVLAAGEQDGKLMLWVELGEEVSPPCRIKVYIYGTGRPLTRTTSQKHVDTVRMSNGYVWHVFTEISC